ncbi:MAG: GNAT family N-acetyltransferase [Gemmatimonadetes bacterium]|nr:GNAT family N-acetyltransferase [Gemmatimonadota bacterium]MDA1104209.1 GNAT family N-acetyltransferase [Gemmatimonadota bacterium]
MTETAPPDRLWTERLLIRVWNAADAPSLRHAIDVSLPELLPWIPFAKDEPTTMDQLRERLDGYAADFVQGKDFLYALVDPDDTEIRGGVGLYQRVGPGALEIGYWLRSDLAGRGLMTEAVAALTGVGLELPGLDRLEIHIDPANGASAAIPLKLGYRHRETLPNRSAGRETMIWEIDRAGLSALPAAPSPGYSRSRPL